MLKISEQIATDNTTTIRLDGTLTEEGLVNLKALIAQYSQNGSQCFVIDMSGVVFMNDEVADELVALTRDRIKFIHCSPFIKTLLQSKVTDSKPNHSGQNRIKEEM